MKKLILVATMAMSVSQLSAREPIGGDIPKLYLGVSTGLENPSGIIGFNFDVPVVEHFSLGAGAGLSSWGYKAYGEGRFYFKPDHRGWAFGAGLTYNTGLDGVELELPASTTYGSGDMNLTLNLAPQTNMFISAYHFFNLGRGGSRFYLNAGYSIPLTTPEVTIVEPANTTLQPDGRTVIDILAPGGLMLGLGFSFALVH